MSNIDAAITRAVTPVYTPLNARELTEVLIKHYDLHSGKYDLMLEFQIGAGMFGPTPNDRIPTAMVSISKFGLIESNADTPNTVDAAMVNPEKKKRSRKTKDD